MKTNYNKFKQKLNQIFWKPTPESKHLSAEQACVLLIAVLIFVFLSSLLSVLGII